jgi:hypothetical protein
MSATKMWEILVPTQMLNINDEMRPIRTKYHRVWDAKVRQITDGLTILTPAKGHWVSPDNELFIEKMIPVRIMAREEQMHEIADMTAKYYRQEAILFYQVSDAVFLKHYGKLPHPSTPKK